VVKTSVAGVAVPSYATNEELAQFATKVYAASNYNYDAAGKALRVNAATIWKLTNDMQKDSPALRKKWKIKKNKPRPRVSVPTNDLEGALKILSQHYPDVVIVALENENVAQQAGQENAL